MSSEPKPFLSVAEVARALGWSESTIHRHSCSIGDYKPERGLIPLIRLGKREYVPRWWLDETLRALSAPPNTVKSEQT